MVYPNDPLKQRQTAMDGRGGGLAQPSYLQARSPKPVTQSAITPRAEVAPGETRAPTRGTTTIAGRIKAGHPAQKGTPAQTGSGSATPGASPLPAAPATPVVADAPVPQTLYDFFKQDLEDQRRTALANTQADASARGVYYGTPLTTSQGDIQTQYLRGLGQLQANVLQNEQQNELSRLGIASNLLNSSPQVQGGGIDPNVFQMLGSLFGGSQALGGQRSGPSAITQRQGKRVGPRETTN